MNRTFSNEFFPSDPATHAIAAKYAYISGNFTESIEHIGYALMHDALCTKHLSLLDKIAANLDEEGTQLGAIRENDHYSSIAARAYLLAYQGDYSAAIALLIQVLAIQPESPFTVWANHWAQDARIAAGLDVDSIAMMLVGFLHRNNSHQKKNLAPLVTLVQALLKHHPKHAQLMCAGAKILRESNQLDEALSCANKALALAPSFSTAVEVAYCYRTMGKLDQASQAFQIALGYDSGDLSRRTEFGDLSLRAAKLEEGLRVLESVLADKTDSDSEKDTLVSRLACAASFPEDLPLAAGQ